MTGWPVAATAEAAPAPVETEAEFIARRNSIIQNWLGAKVQSTEAVEVERALRAQTTAICFPNPTKGTQRIPLGDGYQLKLVYKLNHKLGNAQAVDEDGSKLSISTQVEKLEDAIIEKHGDVGAALLKRLIKWTPELSATEFDKLDKTSNTEADIAAMISEILTIEPATPTLEFEEPKA
jgi:hypothetical protein